MDVRPDDAHRKRPQVGVQQVAERLAIAYVEPAGVQRALEFVPGEAALGQPRIGVGAPVVQGKNFAADSAHDDLLVAEHRLQDAAVGKLLERADGFPSFLREIAHGPCATAIPVIHSGMTR